MGNEETSLQKQSLRAAEPNYNQILIMISV